ncbi:hypothetical protein ABFV05_015445 [Capra hircus]
MQTNFSQLLSASGAAVSEDASASQCVQTRLTGKASCFYSGDVHIQINSIPKECAENLSSRDTTIRSGVHSCSHGCVHSHLWSHSHNEARQPDVTNTEPGDHRSSFSEFKYLFEGLIALGTGLLTTFIYANKSFVNQCVWLLIVLARFSILSYYTFYSQSLHYSFILTFLFMEELCQYYQTFVPIPVWFHYLISYEEFSNIIRWILRILLRQCSDADDICLICQDEFQKPVLLICQMVISDHINKWKHGVTSSQL